MINIGVRGEIAVRLEGRTRIFVERDVPGEEGAPPLNVGHEALLGTLAEGDVTGHVGSMQEHGHVLQWQLQLHQALVKHVQEVRSHHRAGVLQGKGETIFRPEGEREEDQYIERGETYTHDVGHGLVPANFDSLHIELEVSNLKPGGPSD